MEPMAGDRLPASPSRVSEAVEHKLSVFQKQRLEHLELSREVCAADGHCQFRAVAAAGGFRAIQPQTLRLRVGRWLLGRANQYEGFVQGSFGEYVAGMMADSWGDHVSLEALSAILGRRYWRPTDHDHLL
ncbi:OTU10 [Symbiodinium natans]|uniref:OTU10 protein n=1 Tax=Symbiodinium natans TaxID=878477 RepID=A0A812H457_9DINO|nr:OTU10 [Symbiodinium natans]